MVGIVSVFFFLFLLIFKFLNIQNISKLPKAQTVQKIKHRESLSPLHLLLCCPCQCLIDIKSSFSYLGCLLYFSIKSKQIHAYFLTYPFLLMQSLGFDTHTHPHMFYTNLLVNKSQKKTKDILLFCNYFYE